MGKSFCKTDMKIPLILVWLLCVTVLQWAMILFTRFSPPSLTGYITFEWFQNISYTSVEATLTSKRWPFKKYCQRPPIYKFCEIFKVYWYFGRCLTYSAIYCKEMDWTLLEDTFDLYLEQHFSKNILLFRERVNGHGQLGNKHPFLSNIAIQ